MTDDGFKIVRCQQCGDQVRLHASQTRDCETCDVPMEEVPDLTDEQLQAKRKEFEDALVILEQQHLNQMTDEQQGRYHLLRHDGASITEALHKTLTKGGSA